MQDEYSVDSVAQKNVITNVQKEKRRNLNIRATGFAYSPVNGKVLNRAVSEVMAGSAPVIRSEVRTRDDRTKLNPVWGKQHNPR